MKEINEKSLSVKWPKLKSLIVNGKKLRYLIIKIKNSSPFSFAASDNLRRRKEKEKSTNNMTETITLCQSFYLPLIIVQVTWTSTSTRKTVSLENHLILSRGGSFQVSITHLRFYFVNRNHIKSRAWEIWKQSASFPSPPHLTLSVSQC